MVWKVSAETETKKITYFTSLMQQFNFYPALIFCVLSCVNPKTSQQPSVENGGQVGKLFLLKGSEAVQ